MSEGGGRYGARIAAALDRAYGSESVPLLELEAAAARLIVFSDQHRGARDGADDFLRCERAYHAALGHYLERDFRLVVLGDVEELWENSPHEVLAAYPETLALEAEFRHRGGYERVYGNHDDLWRHPGAVAEHLAAVLGEGVAVHEALRVRLEGEDGGELFLCHGHQGTASSDRLAWFSRLVVRYLWRPLQRRLKMASTTPARDFELRERHDAAMFAWARGHAERPVLITGHTHRPVFGASAPDARPGRTPAEVEAELAQARAASPPDPERIAALRAELELVQAEARSGREPAQPVDPPCYFNTGCCSFGDGDVTGLEIADGRIRLVRWLDDGGRPAPKLLAEAGLADVFAAVRGA